MPKNSNNWFQFSNAKGKGKSYKTSTANSEAKNNFVQQEESVCVCVGQDYCQTQQSTATVLQLLRSAVLVGAQARPKETQDLTRLPF